MSETVVLGAGAFGTALAIAIARDGKLVSLVARQGAAKMSLDRENRTYLPGVRFPATLRVTETLDGGGGPVLLAVPTQALAAALKTHRDHLGGRTLVACCKGIDLSSGQGPSKLIAGAVPGNQTAVLTGPSFAADIGRGLPTALTLACREEVDGLALQAQLACSTLRLYLSGDVVGAELGGALKNVIALASGIAIGAGLGESARAAIVTRGFAEMQRVATGMGARPETLTGLSGLGDLVLTATSEKSRNYQAGLRFGAGKVPETGGTIEGIATSQALRQLARRMGFEAPLCSTVAAITQGEVTVAEARDILLARPLRSE